MLLKFFFIFIKDPEPDLDIYVESGAGSGQKSSGSATLTVSQQGFEVFFYVEARGFEDYSRRFFFFLKNHTDSTVFLIPLSLSISAVVLSLLTHWIPKYDLSIRISQQNRSCIRKCLTMSIRSSDGVVCAKIGLKISTDFVPTYLIEWLVCRAFKGRHLLLLAFQSIS